jgi:putative Ca2+/H+ antiporter (TMEM165/GDT1 family)
MYLLLGVLLAFLIVDGIAIIAGSWVTRIIPLQIMKIISGVLFIVFGLVMLIRKEKDAEQ